ncbi:mechanosensitive ion channel domain-containing protein [Litoribrevibacter albus]|uniref:Small-conductance mechanosensitive channel n=1 Tax=Litoribrevibacter albus TaxID=1473156 RepID=A0AA37W8W9_9GAMM|nr:mechanosensitive ion channel domain-containing protein [Litoribrevibacter albus]GLQ31961.1 mechanosensitive ion channel protein MscS [Litoribrevibacter albus]
MKLLLLSLILVAAVLTIRFLNKAVISLGQSKSVSSYRTKYINKTLTLVLIVFYAVLGFTVLGIEYSQVTIFLSSIFAVLGVALFAQWSILSNITASLIIFFGFPYRVGDRIKIIDKDDDISGTVEEIALFHVLIRRGEDLITYPNSLILQKAVVKLSNKPTEPVPVEVKESPTQSDSAN